MYPNIFWTHSSIWHIKTSYTINTSFLLVGALLSAQHRLTFPAYLKSQKLGLPVIARRCNSQLLIQIRVKVPTERIISAYNSNFLQRGDWGFLGREKLRFKMFYWRRSWPIHLVYMCVHAFVRISNIYKLMNCRMPHSALLEKQIIW